MPPQPHTARRPSAIPTLYPDDELLSLRDAARELGVAPQTVWARVIVGDIRARWVISLWVIRRADLDAYKKAGDRRKG